MTVSCHKFHCGRGQDVQLSVNLFDYKYIAVRHNCLWRQLSLHKFYAANKALKLNVCNPWVPINTVTKHFDNKSFMASGSTHHINCSILVTGTLWTIQHTQISTTKCHTKWHARYRRSSTWWHFTTLVHLATMEVNDFDKASKIYPDLAN